MSTNSKYMAKIPKTGKKPGASRMKNDHMQGNAPVKGIKVGGKAVAGTPHAVKGTSVTGVPVFHGAAPATRSK